MRRPRQIVLHFVAGRSPARYAHLQCRIDHRDVSTTLGIRQIQLVSQKPLVEKPDPSGIRSSGPPLDEGFNGLGTGGQKYVLENSQIKALVFEGESKMAIKVG